MRKYSMAVVLTALTFAVTAPVHADLKLPRVSPKATITQAIGITDMTVTYSRPGVKGRTIWGDLVPYDKPWRSGANEATTFTTTDEIQFGGKKLAAGTYALVTIPSNEEWIVVLNTDKDMWGSNGYSQEKDVLRYTAEPSTAEHQEWLGYSFEDLTPNSAKLVLRWEKLKIAVPITVDVNGRALADSRKAMAELKADDWRTPYQAANFAFTSETATEEGKAWLTKSLVIQENYNNLTLLARWQQKEGKKKDAIATAQKAIAAGKASKEKVDTAGTEKLVSDWTGDK